MGPMDRRAVIGGAVLAGAAGIARAQSAPKQLGLADIRKEADMACLYHCDFGEPQRFSQMINNIGNHYSVYGANPFDAQICIVAHSAGVKFFFDTVEGTPWAEELTVPKIFERVEAQIKNGLKIYLCAITFERLKLDRAKVRKNDAIAFVPSGVATVAALQGKGFAYLKVG
ncbi:DsrE family protein [Rhabdaerophilum sp. SD176]|uniref:DsrE family protein n=1 Tax=Rhabdaerophilum sp. SD176 TaxID=2983548 RepID=UPI0024DFA5B8|nr:DsrE family protein [Rhabdaerophilum sp. SD176]